MAPHKKGQGFAGPYTEIRTMTTPSTMHDEYGYLIGKGETADQIEAASDGKLLIAPITDAPGLSARLPKGVKGR